jgi:hypothetical protein
MGLGGGAARANVRLIRHGGRRLVGRQSFLDREIHSENWRNHLATPIMRSMQSVRALLSVMLALALAVSTSQSVLSIQSVQSQPQASDMVMHDVGTHSAMPGTCHKCVHKAPCCALCVSTPAILIVTSYVMKVSTKPGVALLTEPQFKNSTIRPIPPPPKLADLT